MIPDSTSGLFPIVYDELRRLAAKNLASESVGHTLNATALVHEAYMQLQTASTFESKGHFFRAAAEAMRHILIDHARKKRAKKRGGKGKRFEVTDSDLVATTDPDTLLTINEALDKLTVEDATAAEVAKLKLFAGLSIEEAAETLGMSRATAYRDWTFARACLMAALLKD